MCLGNVYSAFLGGVGMKRRILVISILLILFLSGCEKNVFINEPTEPRTIGFVLEEFTIESSNPEYYSKIADLFKFKYPEILEDKEEWEKYGYAARALSWKLDQNIDNPNMKYHVVLEFFSENSIDVEIEKINENYNMDFNVRDWFDMEYGDYYTILSREEVIALGNSKKFFVWYVGSGEGDYNKVDVTTEEGLAEFVELYGDGYVQCIEGKEIINYIK